MSPYRTGYEEGMVIGFESAKVWRNIGWNEVDERFVNANADGSTQAFEYTILHFDAKLGLACDKAEVLLEI